MNDVEQIDKQIADLGDWRGARLQWFRELVKANYPQLKEELKWGVGVFTLKGKPVLASSAFKGHTKFNFFNGATLSDRKNLFNSGLDSKLHRSINLGEHDEINVADLRELIDQAMNRK